MRLYLLKQSELTEYCTYDSAVVAAETAEDAVMIHPDTYVTGWAEREPNKWDGVSDGKPFMTWVYKGGHTHDTRTWPPPQKVTAILIGVAEPSIQRGVVCASFDAG